MLYMGCVIALEIRLRAVEAPTDMIDQLGGWALKSVGQGYGDGYELELLVKYLSNYRLMRINSSNLVSISILDRARGLSLELHSHLALIHLLTMT